MSFAIGSRMSVVAVFDRNSVNVAARAMNNNASTVVDSDSKLAMNLLNLHDKCDDCNVAMNTKNAPDNSSVGLPRTTHTPIAVTIAKKKHNQIKRRRTNALFYVCVSTGMRNQACSDISLM